MLSLSLRFSLFSELFHAFGLWSIGCDVPGLGFSFLPEMLFILLHALWPFWVYDMVSVMKFGKLSASISSTISSTQLFLFLSEAPIMHAWDDFIVSHSSCVFCYLLGLFSPLFHFFLDFLFCVHLFSECYRGKPVSECKCSQPEWDLLVLTLFCAQGPPLTGQRSGWTLLTSACLCLPWEVRTHILSLLADRFFSKYFGAVICNLSYPKASKQIVNLVDGLPIFFSFFIFIFQLLKS